MVDKPWRNIIAFVTVSALIAALSGSTAYAASGGILAGLTDSKPAPLPGSVLKAGTPLAYATILPLIKYSNSAGTLGGKHKNIHFTGHRIHIVMIAVEPGSPKQSYEIHKLVNPEIVVPTGAKITLTLLNMDYGPAMFHGVIIGKAQPPYRTVVPAPTPGQIAAIPLVMPRSLKSVGKATYFVGITTFTAPKTTGTYYYLCQMPGHAKDGMYGRFVVGAH